jgi:hypothetical protein
MSTLDDSLLVSALPFGGIADIYFAFGFMHKWLYEQNIRKQDVV